MSRRNGSAETGLGERTLAAGFRGFCLVLRAAAYCCGHPATEPSSARANPRVDLQALVLLGCVPLGEIAAAERELRGCADSVSPLARDTLIGNAFVPATTPTPDPLRSVQLEPV